jgi:hypothetical protein
MLKAAFELGEKIALRKLNYFVYEELWNRCTIPMVDISFDKWISLKYLNNDGNGFSDEINSVPPDSGGLYLFYVKCPLIVGMTEYPFYIGRAQLTKSQNLRKRVKEYFYKYKKTDERPKITKMFEYWGKDLHLAYIVLKDNDTIIEFEKNLINSLLLPMNDEIPDTKIKQAIKAFDL